MSGGSLNYVSIQEGGDILGGRFDEDLRYAIERLRGFGYDRPADDLQALLNEALAMRDKFDPFRKLLHELEWHLSGDTGPDHLKKLADEWKPKS